MSISLDEKSCAEKVQLFILIEVVRMTGSKKSFTKDEVVSFFLKAVDEDNIYLFSEQI